MKKKTKTNPKTTAPNKPNPHKLETNKNKNNKFLTFPRPNYSSIKDGLDV